MALYIGLMSGTSTDGVDAVLCRFAPDHAPKLLAHHSLSLPAALRRALLDLNQPQPNELEHAHQCSLALARLYADACHALLHQSGTAASEVRAIGAHGQTIRHRPDLGYTIQLNAPALLAELTGIAVVADFRSRDVAAGGQGAPLVPPVHQALFGHPEIGRVVLNLGGIANITVLHPNHPLLGFDTGPANMLLDHWVHQQLGHEFDEAGQWAQQGHVLPQLLNQLLSEAWLQLPPPKSTGRDLFNSHWLHQHLTRYTAEQNQSPNAVDVQATLLEFTAQTVVQAIQRYGHQPAEIIACGGGARNTFLLQRLTQLSGCKTYSSTALGMDPQHVEALAFAWLAHAHVERLPANAPAVTGARRPVVLGAYYPA